MAITLLPPDKTFGSSFATGLSEGLNLLAQAKMNQLANMNRVKQYESVNIPSPIAQLLAGASDKERSQLLDRLQGLELAQPQQSLQALQQLSGSGQLGQPVESIQQQMPSPQITLGPSSAERRHKENILEKRRMHIDKLAAPIFKDIEKEGAAARRVVNVAQEAKNLLATGKAITGPIAKLIPKEFQTSEGQQLLSKINELVLLKAQLGKGVPSRMRLVLEELAKPAVWQKPEAANKLLDSIINDPEFLKAIDMDEAKEKLLQDYPDIPKDFKKIISKESKNISKQRSLSTLEKALPAKDNPGKIARNPETGQRAQVIDGKWVYIDEER